VQRVGEREAHRSGQVHLGQDGQVRRVEDRRVLERLVLALGHREEHDPQGLAEVVTGGADEVAHVLDEEHVEGGEVPALEGRGHHGRLQVADRAGDDPADRRARTAQALRVTVGGEVADERGPAPARR